MVLARCGASSGDCGGQLEAARTTASSDDLSDEKLQVLLVLFEGEKRGEELREIK